MNIYDRLAAVRPIDEIEPKKKNLVHLASLQVSRDKNLLTAPFGVKLVLLVGFDGDRTL
jgi:hypothetical protein